MSCFIYYIAIATIQRTLYGYVMARYIDNALSGPIHPVGMLHTMFTHTILNDDNVIFIA